MKTNILWLNSDHYAYAHHFALNRSQIRTPAFDRLCAQGTLFQNAYTVCPLCTPARASLATGQYPHRHGILNNEARFGSRTDFKPDAPLYSRALAEAGYHVALFGKWHAQGPEGSSHNATAQDHGFEGWTLPGYGFPYRTAEYENYLRELGLSHPTVNVEWSWGNPAQQGRKPLAATSDIPHHASCGVIEGPAETHEAYFVAHLARRYLEERAHDGQPFCLRVDPWGPHQPYYSAPPFADTVDPAAIAPPPNFAHDLADRPAHHRLFRERVQGNRGTRSWDELAPVMARCYEQIALVDNAHLGLLDDLDRLGLSENTVVLYSADHGDVLGAHGGLFDKGWLMVEETMRIPLAVRGPGIPNGRVTEALVSNLDIVATLREIADAPPAGDGASLLPWAEPSGVGREDLMLESHGHIGEYVFQRMLRWREWKYVAHLDDRDELYDLQTDPYELTNRIDDPALNEVRQEVQDRLVCQMEQTGDDAPDAVRLRRRLTEMADAAMTHPQR